MKTSQLRTYTVRPGQMDAFVELWRTGIVPARLAHGFTVEGAWISRAEDRFVWIVAWDGDESWEEKDAAYYASPERAAVSPDPSTFLASVETLLVEPLAAR